MKKKYLLIVLVCVICIGGAFTYFPRKLKVASDDKEVLINYYPYSSFAGNDVYRPVIKNISTDSDDYATLVEILEDISYNYRLLDFVFKNAPNETAKFTTEYTIRIDLDQDTSIILGSTKNIDSFVNKN